MLFTRFKDSLPPEKELLLIADPFYRKLRFGYMMNGMLYSSTCWEDGHCVFAVGSSLESSLYCNPNLSWLLLGEMSIKPKELNGEMVSLFKSHAV